MSDVWSYGATIVEMYTGHPYHYSSLPPPRISEKVLLDPSYHPELPPLPSSSTGIDSGAVMMSPSLRSLLLATFQRDPLARIGVPQIIEMLTQMIDSYEKQQQANNVSMAVDHYGAVEDRHDVVTTKPSNNSK